MVRTVAGFKKALRIFQTIEVVQPFRECEHSDISLIAVILQADLIRKEEAEIINSSLEVVQLLVKLLETTLANKNEIDLTFEVVELLEAIKKLAVNDVNKEQIVRPERCRATSNYYSRTDI